MGPLPHDYHCIAVGNSDSLQAEAAPGHACTQAAGATASTATTGRAPRAATATVTAPCPASISDNQGNHLQSTPASDLGLWLSGHLLEEAQGRLNS